VALKTILAFLNIGWPLSREDVGNVYSISGRGTNAIKVGDEPSLNGGIGKVVFHHAEFALSILLSPIELNSLVLYHLKFVLVCSISVYVSNNTRVLEIYNGIVD